jgi:hypothetical protein
MKKAVVSIFLSIFCLSLSYSAFSQNAVKWEPVYLTVSGGNILDGVEAYFRADVCNSESVIFIKFINRNNYSVKLSWFDAVFTTEAKWINKNSAGELKTVTLTSNTELAGDCSSANPNLTVKLKDFINQTETFKRYAASNLVISVD